MATAAKWLFILFIALVFIPVQAFAKPVVKISVKAEKEVIVEKNGKKDVTRVAADTVKPGEMIFYTLFVSNDGDEKATRVVVNNPIPDGTLYVGDSVFGDGSRILFSVDDGKVFNAGKKLMIETPLKDGKKEKKLARPDQYTNIQWVINEILPGRMRVLGFYVMVQ